MTEANIFTVIFSIVTVIVKSMRTRGHSDQRKNLPICVCQMAGWAICLEEYKNNVQNWIYFSEKQVKKHNLTNPNNMLLKKSIINTTFYIKYSKDRRVYCSCTDLKNN